MQRLAELCERIGATTKKTEKVALLAEYFRSLETSNAAIAAVFLAGGAFPAFDERTLQIGGSALWKLVGEITGAREPALTAAYRKRGDLGAAAYDVLLPKAPAESAITLRELRAIFDQIAETRTAAAKSAILKSLLERATALEAKYILKIITGELRIGLKESLVEEAIAKAYEEPPASVQRSNMLLGDIGGTLTLAAEHRLDAAHAIVSSTWLHAGQPRRRCRRGVPLLRAWAGRRQVRRHSRAGALRARAGAAVLADAR